MLNCVSLNESFLEFIPRTFACSQDGPYLQVNTPYRYGTSEPIDLYVRQLNETQCRITDMAQTMRLLDDFSAGLLTVNTEQIKWICKSYHVSFAEKTNAFYCDTYVSSIAEGIQRLAEAVKEVYALQHFSKPIPKQRDYFNKYIERWLTDRNITGFKKEPLKLERAHFSFDLVNPTARVVLQAIRTDNADKVIRTSNRFSELNEVAPYFSKVVLFNSKPNEDHYQLLSKTTENILNIKEDGAVKALKELVETQPA